MPGSTWIHLDPPPPPPPTHTHLVFLQKLGREGPRCVSEDFIDVAAVSQRFVAFVLRHDGEAFELVGQLVAANCATTAGTHESTQTGSISGMSCFMCCLEGLTSNDEVRVGEKVLGLHESASVSSVEQVKDAIRVDSHRAVH